MAADYLPAVSVDNAAAGMGFDVWAHAPSDDRPLLAGTGHRVKRVRLAENIGWPEARALRDAWVAAGWPQHAEDAS